VQQENILRPFIRWAGGKQTLIKHLQANLPDKTLVKRYWEPFLGAGSLFFANDFKKAELSDVNSQLINSYNQIKKDPKAVYDLLQFFKDNFNTSYYYQLRLLYNNQIDECSVEQAARFIFLVHTCFNGIYRVNAKGHYNVPIGKMNPSLPSYEHLVTISKKLKGIKIVNRSYADILIAVKEKDFIYLDPPYPKLDDKDQFQQYTPDKFSQKHQIELAEFANKLRAIGCFVMISNSKVPLIEELYKDWIIEEVPVIRYVSCKKERIKLQELIIKNY